MYICTSCDHPLVFHRPHGGSEPCCLCPPDDCLVENCRCVRYDGMKLTILPHRSHRSTGTRWGSWGVLFFAMKDDQIIVSGAEPIVEKVVIRR